MGALVDVRQELAQLGACLFLCAFDRGVADLALAVGVFASVIFQQPRPRGPERSTIVP